MKLFNKKSITIFSSACLYAYISLKFIPDYSRDYNNIKNSIDFTIKNLEIDFLWILYHIKGNTILLMPFDIIRVINGEKSAYLIFFVAIVLRFYMAFKYLNFKTAIAFIFAFFWMLDWNQSRFSIAFSLFILLSPKRQFIQLFIHYGLILRLIYERFTYVKRFYYLLPFVAILVVSSIKLFFTRYFLPSEDGFPIYSLVYICFFILITCLNKDYSSKKRELIFGFSTQIFFLIIINGGLSWTYFGRCSEIILMISIANYIKNFKNQSFNTNVLFRTILYTIGFYQLITVNGNIWRFFT